MALKHTKTSAKSDGADSTQVQPSDWNAEHVADAGGVQMAVASTDPAPSAGFANVYTKAIGGYTGLKWVGSNGVDKLAQTHLGQDKVAWGTAIGNATTVIAWTGIVAPTYLGTATARNWASTNLVTRTRRIAYVSSSTAGSLAGAYWTVAQFSLGVPGTPNVGGFLCVIRFAVSDAAAVSGARMFVGMSSSTSAATNVEPSTLTNSVGVAAISTSSNLQIVYGGSAAQTAIDLGSNFPANSLSADLYELALYANPGANNTVGYKVTRLNTGHVAEGTLTAATPGTQLPANATALCMRAWRCNNATALAVGLDLVSFYIQTDD
ncbi:hypothetical protein [Mesoterricola sediminis]|uniref:Uncharacterized protein n=1 Tax=Mesoterricola sediminis TaxID=2927980 RepID=A0AA48GU67_9BACT|nr:hypothetical protein [Mesoterricola sediminis]BDU76289.1 hypothetical protein METESE_12470 [Mesoterricola sediminis]